MSRTVTKSDAALQQDVIDELTWDTRVLGAEVSVAVRAGVVILSGVVDSWAIYVATQRAAHRVAGVLDVANELKVKLSDRFCRDDADIALLVRQSLERHVLVRSERIQSTVSDGVVTLEGLVQCWNEHDDAEHAVRNLIGVREVKNLLGVSPPEIPSETVRAAIGAAIERQLQDGGRGVDVKVVDGRVTLSGEVESRAEREAILGAVRSTPGVRSIEAGSFLVQT